jgi:hypothetical protein
MIRLRFYRSRDRRRVLIARFAAHSQCLEGALYAKGADRAHGRCRRVGYGGEGSLSAVGERNLKLLGTGGAGLIGSALVRYLVHASVEEIVNLYNLTYAGAGFNANAFPLASRIADEVPNVPMGAHLSAGKVAAAIATILAPDLPK